MVNYPTGYCTLPCIAAHGFSFASLLDKGPTPFICPPSSYGPSLVSLATYRRLPFIFSLVPPLLYDAVASRKGHVGRERAGQGGIGYFDGENLIARTHIFGSGTRMIQLCQNGLPIRVRLFSGPYHWPTTTTLSGCKFGPTIISLPLPLSLSLSL